MVVQVNTEKTIRPTAPSSSLEPSDRGKVLQWRPRSTMMDRESDLDFFEFVHRAPATRTTTSAIFSVVRRRLPIRRARTLPLKR